MYVQKHLVYPEGMYNIFRDFMFALKPLDGSNEIKTSNPCIHIHTTREK